MKHTMFRFHAFFYHWRRLVSGEMIALGMALVIVVSPAFALRFETRTLQMDSALPDATTNYHVSLQYMSPDPVGSVSFLFCTSPIPYLTPGVECVPPPGLDASNATLTSQTGETGFTITQQSTNEIVLSRAPTIPVATTPSTYTFSGIVNPSGSGSVFAIRLESHTTTDASGPYVDFGSVRGEVTNAIVLQTQVPPMLIFCVAQVVQMGCTGTNGNYYSDMGDLNDHTTLTASSQMAVGTNASGGFAITAFGDLLSAGTNVLDSPVTPTASQTGTNQFGINLVANTEPVIGTDPEGGVSNEATPNYAQPNKYMFVPGDIVADSSAVSLMQRYTVSYIINSSPSLRAGVYTTTITYLASGRF